MFSVLLGVAKFAEGPDIVALIGMALIVASGVGSALISLGRAEGSQSRTKVILLSYGEWRDSREAGLASSVYRI
ncbi:MAG: hypothetical protein ABWZ80_06935 [Beijerinckiaceae bacterium]